MPARKDHHLSAALCRAARDHPDDPVHLMALADYWQDVGVTGLAEAVRWMLTHDRRPFRHPDGSERWGWLLRPLGPPFDAARALLPAALTSGHGKVDKGRCGFLLYARSYRPVAWCGPVTGLSLMLFNLRLVTPAHPLLERL